MGLNPNDEYGNLKEHLGHEIVIADYHGQNIAIECETCHCVLQDFDKEPEVEPLWEDTRLQAVRLIAEIMATQHLLDMPILCESMDVEMDELNELLNRIDKEWEESKKRNCPVNHLTNL